MPDDTPKSGEPTADPVEHLAQELRELEGIGEKKHWGRWLFGAVLLVALVVTIVRWQQTRKIVTPPVAGAGVRIEMQEPQNVKLEAVPTFFKWESIAGRNHYVLRILDERGLEAIIERRVKNNNYSLSADEATKLRPGNRYTWQVQAIAPDGVVLGAGRSAFEL